MMIDHNTYAPQLIKLQARQEPTQSITRNNVADSQNKINIFLSIAS